MKKLALISVVAACAAMPAFAAEEMKAPAAAPAEVSAPAPAIAAPATSPAAAPAVLAPVAPSAPAAVEAKTVELKDGAWVKIAGDDVSVSKDAGKSWAPAPDGTWEAKDGSKLTTKGGKVAGPAIAPNAMAPASAIAPAAAPAPVVAPAAEKTN